MRPYSGTNPQAINDPTVRSAVMALHDFALQLNSGADATRRTYQTGTATVGGSGGGVTDHGALTGLDDDDHEQYLLLDGRTGGQTVEQGLNIGWNSGTRALRVGTSGSSNLFDITTGASSMTWATTVGQLTWNVYGVGINGSSASVVPFYVEGTSNSNTDVQRWYNDGQGEYAAMQVKATGISLYSEAGVPFSFFVGSPGGGSEQGFTLNGSSYLQFIRTKLSTGASTPALLGIDAANVSTTVADSDDNIRIVRRSATQSGMALRVMEQTRTNTLASIDATGAGVLTGTLGINGSTSGTITISAGATPTSHTLTLPSANASGVLTNNGSGTLSWAAASSSNALLDGTNHTDTTNSACTRGDIIYGNSSAQWDDLPIGSANTVLRSDGTDPSWGAIDKAYISNRQRRLWFPAAVFETTAKSLTGTNPYAMARISLAGTADGYNHFAFIPPDDYVSTLSFKIWWSAAAAHATQVWRARLIIQDVTNSDTTVASGTETTISVSVNGISANFAYATTGFTNPDNLALTVGNLYRVNFCREASTDASDNFTNNVYFHGLELIYTADM